MFLSVFFRFFHFPKKFCLFFFHFSVFPFFPFIPFFRFFFFFIFFSFFSPPPPAPPGLAGSPSINIASFDQSLNFKARLWVREERKKKEEEKKEERADRNRPPSAIARTGTFCHSRA